MQSTYTLAGLALAAMAAGAPVAAQQTGAPGGRPGQQTGAAGGQQQPRGPQAWPETTKGRQHQEMIRNMDQLMDRIRETNRWMAQRQPAEGFRAMGQQMERAAGQLGEMLREINRLHQNPAVTQDRDRLRETDRLRDRLHDMQREMEQAHDALRKAIGQR